MLRTIPFLLAAIALGQTRPEFEVIAIHPAGAQVPYAVQFTASELKFTATTVRDFINMAYQLLPTQLKGGPDWIDSERFEIHAKSSVDFATEDASYQAIQNLLADRFHLKMRRDMVEKRTYAIVVVDRSKLKVTSAPENTRPSAAWTPVGTDEVDARVKNFAIGDFLWSLSKVRETLVTDETGLSGRFDFEGTMEKPAPGSTPNWQPLLEKFGLRLESRQTPVAIYTIESVEHPSEN